MSRHLFRLVPDLFPVEVTLTCSLFRPPLRGGTGGTGHDAQEMRARLPGRGPGVGGDVRLARLMADGDDLVERVERAARSRAKRDAMMARHSLRRICQLRGPESAYPGEMRPPNMPASPSGKICKALLPPSMGGPCPFACLFIAPRAPKALVFTAFRRADSRLPTPAVYSAGFIGLATRRPRRENRVFSGVSATAFGRDSARSVLASRNYAAFEVRDDD